MAMAGLSTEGLHPLCRRGGKKTAPFQPYISRDNPSYIQSRLCMDSEAVSQSLKRDLSEHVARGRHWIIASDEDPSRMSEKIVSGTGGIEKGLVSVACLRID